MGSSENVSGGNHHRISEREASQISERESTRESIDASGTIAGDALTESGELFSPRKTFNLNTLKERVKPAEEVSEKKLVSIIQRVRQWVSTKIRGPDSLPENKTHVAVHERFIKSRDTVGKSMLSPEKEGHKEIKDYIPFKSGQPTDLLHVDANLFLSPEDLKTKHKDFELQATIAAEAGIHLDSENLLNFEKTENVGQMVPVRFIKNEDGTIGIEKNQVTPTSFIKGSKSETDKSHLMNTYYTVVEDQSRAIIRTGCIDSPQRADEFLALLIDIRQQTFGEDKPDDKTFKLRVCSQQLNSFESERKIIKNQHAQLSRINQTAKWNEGIEIAHLNTPTNKFYQFTLFARKIPLVGALAEKLYLKGERLSKDQNLIAMGTYLRWLNEDLKEIGYTFLDESRKSEIDKLTAEIDDLKKQDQTPEIVQELKEKQAELKQVIGRAERTLNLTTKIEQLVQAPPSHENAKLLKKSRGELKQILRKQSRELDRIEVALKASIAGSNDITEIKELEANLRKVTLMKKVLNSQLDIKPMSRGTEELTFQALNEELGVTSAINCKSGLDRTGFLHSVSGAVTAFRNKGGETDIEDMHTLTTEWETITQRINQAVANAKPGEDPIKKLYESLSPEDKIKFGNVIEFRKVVLTNLLKQGLPITFISTGVLGAKWHKGMKENLIPLNFLPPFIEVGEGKDKQVIQLVNYNKEGEITGLTTAGHQLITKLQSTRGS